MPLFNFRTKHLFIIILALIAGITCHVAVACSIICCTLAMWITFFDQHRTTMIMVGCCFFLLGQTRYLQNEQAYFHHLDLLDKQSTVVATIQEIMPRLDDQEQICMVLQAHTVTINQKAHALNKKIYLFLPFYTKLWVQPHQKIELYDITLKHPHAASYEQYLLKEGIWAVAHQKRFAYKTIQKPSLLMQQINQWCSLPLATTEHNFSELTQTLYLSIFCGKKIKSATTTKMKELFQYWGISHHLARSGLHLIILIWLLLFLLSWIPCQGRTKQWIAIVVLCLYYMMTYPSIAFTRAFYMYLLYALCKQLYLPHNALHILLITALLILMFNPHHLFFLDFQLSFSITLLILWFAQATQNTKTIAS